MLYRPCHQRNVSCSPNSSIDTLPCSSLSFRNSKGVIQQAHFWHLIQPFSTSTLGNSSRRSQCNGNSFLTVFVHFCMVQQGEVGVFPLFHGLYGVLYIQSQNPWMMVDDGEHWVMWELDDAMFLESGGLISCVMPFSSLQMFLDFGIHMIYNSIKDQNIYRHIFVQMVALNCLPITTLNTIFTSFWPVW